MYFNYSVEVSWLYNDAARISINLIEKLQRIYSRIAAFNG